MNNSLNELRMEWEEGLCVEAVELIFDDLLLVHAVDPNGYHHLLRYFTIGPHNWEVSRDVYGSANAVIKKLLVLFKERK